MKMTEKSLKYSYGFRVFEAIVFSDWSKPEHFFISTLLTFKSVFLLTFLIIKFRNIYTAVCWKQNSSEKRCQIISRLSRFDQMDICGKRTSIIEIVKFLQIVSSTISTASFVTSLKIGSERAINCAKYFFIVVKMLSH